jgi:hypothetical protein
MSDLDTIYSKKELSEMEADRKQRERLKIGCPKFSFGNVSWDVTVIPTFSIGKTYYGHLYFSFRFLTGRMSIRL